MHVHHNCAEIKPLDSKLYLTNRLKSPEKCEIQGLKMSLQFEEVKHPELGKAFGSTIFFFLQSLYVSVVIGTVCTPTGGIEDKAESFNVRLLTGKIRGKTNTSIRLDLSTLIYA